MLSLHVKYISTKHFLFTKVAFWFQHFLKLANYKIHKTRITRKLSLNYTNTLRKCTCMFEQLWWITEPLKLEIGNELNWTGIQDNVISVVKVYLCQIILMLNCAKYSGDYQCFWIVFLHTNISELRSSAMLKSIDLTY